MKQYTPFTQIEKNKKLLDLLKSTDDRALDVVRLLPHPSFSRNTIVKIKHNNEVRYGLVRNIKGIEGFTKKHCFLSYELETALNVEAGNEIEIKRVRGVFKLMYAIKSSNPAVKYPVLISIYLSLISLLLGVISVI